MQLGAFSLSLNVKDIQASRAFYEQLGFEAFMGDAAQGWLILRNGTSVIGLFQGMLLFFVLGCDTLIHYRIRLVGLGAPKLAAAPKLEEAH